MGLFGNNSNKKPTKKEAWADIKEKGLDLETRKYLEKKILNPHLKVERHEKPSDSYDYKYKPRFGKYKKTTHVEVKGTTAKQTQPQKEFEKNHPRSYEVERGRTDDTAAKFMKAGRKIKRQFDD